MAATAAAPRSCAPRRRRRVTSGPRSGPGPAPPAPPSAHVGSGGSVCAGVRAPGRYGGAPGLRKVGGCAATPCLPHEAASSAPRCPGLPRPRLLRVPHGPRRTRTAAPASSGLGRVGVWSAPEACGTGSGRARSGDGWAGPGGAEGAQRREGEAGRRRPRPRPRRRPGGRRAGRCGRGHGRRDPSEGQLLGACRTHQRPHQARVSRRGRRHLQARGRRRLQEARDQEFPRWVRGGRGGGPSPWPLGLRRRRGGAGQRGLPLGLYSWSNGIE